MIYFSENMRSITLSNTGETIPVLGQGTWGVSRIKGFFKGKEYEEEIKEALRTGINLGMNHIDTAEFYGHGKAERIVGEIIEEVGRDNLFITSKLFPMHLWKRTMKKAARKSLKRLGIDQLDLYLIHWPSPFQSIKKQMRVMEELVKEGKTRYIGVSNFSVKQFKKAQEFLKKEELVTNQLHANLTKQKHIHESLPYYKEKNIILTAYSPLAHEGYTDIEDKLKKNLENIAKQHDATIQQIAIAWLINHENVITIPKAFTVKHVKSNAKAAGIKLSQQEKESFYEFRE